MKLFLLNFLTAIIIASCSGKKPNSEVIQDKDTILITPKSNTESVQVEDTLLSIIKLRVHDSINKRLERHFELYRIKPSMEVNNTEGNITDIKLGNHRIKWLDLEDETKIKIDNDLFTLKDKVTLNIVWSNRNNVDFANSWDEIKLFKHNNKEYIGIRMSFSPCTGLGCSVDFFLIYDVATKSKNFFGSFRTDNELELYDFLKDDKVDYISKTFSGDAHGSTSNENIYKLYSIDTNGEFIEQKDKNGLPYYINHTTFPNDNTKSDELTENWITKIK